MPHAKSAPVFFFCQL
uniref:Uncharacterized protein n=1 Tax=Arundo donax TaxID=35708 RepID=A0A0A9AVZ9_ARUDO